MSDSARRFRIFPLLALWAINVCLLALAYQTRLPATIWVGGDDWLYTGGYLENLHSVTTDGATRFRFTRETSVVSFPFMGQTSPLEMTMRVNAWRPEGVRAVTLAVNGLALREIANGEWRTHRTVIMDTARFGANAFELGLASETFVPKDYDAHNADTRALGPALEWVTLTPQTAPNAPWWQNLTQPAWVLVLVVGLLGTLAYTGSVLLGAPRVGLTLGLALVVFFAAVVAFARVSAAAYLVPAAGVVLGALLLLTLRGTQTKKRGITVALVLGVICLAWGARWVAATHMPLSGDEQIYVPVSAQYADAIAGGRAAEILTSRENVEHPLFNKLAFAASMLINRASGGVSDLLSARYVSIAASALLTALLAFVNPIAAVALAVHSIQIQYASQAYLEALPALTIAVAIIAFERARVHGTRWLILSAVCLGLTAASKYIYAIAGFALFPFLVWRYRHTPLLVVVYGVAAAALFFVANPFLWTNPVGNFLETLSFHNRVSGSELVAEYARPVWWHLAYLSRLTDFNPGIPYVSLDTLVFIGGILGLPALWRHSRVYFAWFVVALVFLLLWNTKWEQYALTLITPLCLSFGFGLSDAAKRVFARHTRTTRSVAPASQ